MCSDFFSYLILIHVYRDSPKKHVTMALSSQHPSILRECRCISGLADLRESHKAKKHFGVPSCKTNPCEERRHKNARGSLAEQQFFFTKTVFPKEPKGLKTRHWGSEF